SGGDTVTLSADHGTVGTVTDNSDGTYTAELSDTTAETDTVSGTINTIDITDTATVEFTPGAADATTTTISASPTSTTVDGSSTITVQAKDQYGNDLTSGGDTVTLSTDHGSLTSVTDNTDGTYSATLTA